VEESGSVVGSVGTNVRYAAAHEYGFKGDVQVQVQGHVRKAASRSTFRNAGATVTANGISVRKGKMRSQGIAFVQPHVRSVNMPERSFLRSTLREFSDKIKRDVRAAALEALK
jgi:phage gpG-like protein